jgi:hypothetical protein
MELALNVVWLLLALPAVWIWRYRPARANHANASFVPILVLGCVLVLLFPVISASDDLHTVGMDIEEPGPQRWVKQCAGERCPSQLFSSGKLPMQLTASSLHLRSADTIWGLVVLGVASVPVEPTASKVVARGPPTALFS